MRGIDPRISRMQSERSTIWPTSPYSSSFELALNKTHEISVFHLLRVVNSFSLSASTNQTCRIFKNVLEMRGIDPRTSRMQSERSTIFATPPYSSSFELGCQFLPIISKYKWELSNPQKCFGDAGHRSPYLSHAKRALYHLRYIPVLFKLRASFWTQFMKNRFSIRNELSILSHYQQIQMRVIESSKMFWRCGASISVPLAC